MVLDPRDDAAAEAMGRDPKTGRLILVFCTAAGALGAALSKSSGLTEGMGSVAEIATLYGSFAVAQCTTFTGVLAHALKSPYVTEWVDPYPFENADEVFAWEQETGAPYPHGRRALG